MKTKRFWKIFSICLSVLVLALGITLSCVDFSHEEQIEPPSYGATGPTNSGYWTTTGNYGTTEWSGSGTESDPYLIQSAKDLARLSYLVYSGNGTHSGNCYYQNTYFKQTADIDLSAYWWQPIGLQFDRYGNSSLRYFSGNYDGGGHTVSGVFTPAGTTNGYSYKGLFGSVYSGSSDITSHISNIGVIDSNIQGYQSVGGICGNIERTQISNCYYMGTISASDNYAGGVAGRLVYSTVVNCYNTGSVSGTSYLGGVAGYGIYSTIINCYNTGNVSGSGSNFGGVAGYNNGGTISKCYYGGNCTLSTGIGNGSDSTGVTTKITSLHNYSYARNKSWYTNTSNWDSSYPWDFRFTWRISSNVNNGYPVLYSSSNLTINLNGGSGSFESANLFGEIEDVGSASSLIRNTDVNYYIKNGSIYASSTSNSLEDHYGHIETVNAYLVKGVDCKLSLRAVSRTSSVLNSTVEGGMFLNGGYDLYYFNTGPTVNSTSTPVLFTCSFTPTVSGTYGLRIDTNLNNASYRLYDIKITQNTSNNYYGSAGNQMNLPTPTRTGYTFKGWSLSGGGSLSSNVYTFGFGDATLTANWEIAQVDVTLNQAGGSGGTTSVKVKLNSAMPTLSSLPTREGYNFQGYYRGENGTGTKYYNANGTSACVYNLTTGTTLYAYWTLDTWVDHVTVTTFGGGSGDSVNDPYIISTPQHLALLAKNVNNGTTYSGKYFLQTADLNMGAYPWMPIGLDTTNNFQGNFDGDKYKISGLQINDSTLQFIGLFGFISNATVQNIRVVDSLIIASKFYSRSYTGSIVAGPLNASTIRNCSSSAKIQSEHDIIGGIVGYAPGTGVVIDECVFTGEISSSNRGRYLGGIAGTSAGTISNSSSYAVISSPFASACLGGIAGISNGVITNCISNSTLSSVAAIGGIVGSANSGCNMTDCAGFGFIYGEDATKSGGLIGKTNGTANVTNSSFYGSSNLDIGIFYGSANSTALNLNSCYSYINNKGYYTTGDFNDFTIAGDFNDGLPIQNALYAIGIWENRGSEVIKFFTDNNFELVS